MWLACAATLAVHLLFVTRHLGSDEGGYSVVAAHWFDGGPFVYGSQWVDRPPGLIGLFDVADRLGPYGVRLTASAARGGAGRRPGFGGGRGRWSFGGPMGGVDRIRVRVLGPA